VAILDPLDADGLVAADDGGGGGAVAADGLHEAAVGAGGEAVAAVLLGNGEAEHAQLAELLDDLRRDRRLRVEPGAVQLVAGEAVERLQDQVQGLPLLVVQAWKREDQRLVHGPHEETADEGRHGLLVCRFGR